MLYLLGLLRPEDSTSVEERLVADSEFYDEVLIAEDELIDQYLAGELSEVERERFENHFLLVPERQGKMRFGRALNRYISAADPLPDENPVTEDVADETRPVPKPPPKPWYSIFLPSQNPVLSYSLAAAVVIIVAGISWLAWQNFRNPPPTSGELLAVTLRAGTTRGDGDVQRISIPPGTSTVQLRLSLTKSDYPKYRAVVLGESRSPVLIINNLQPQIASGALFVGMNAPAHSLPPGDYQVKLSGQLSNGEFEDLSSYRFRVGR